MRINQNIAAFNAYRNLNHTQSQLSSSLEKLSSGFRINRAADDASGLVNSENLRAQIGGLKVATRNAQDAISMVQTAEGAQTEVHSILQRMRDLVAQTGNLGTNDDAAIKANNDEIAELKAELTRISEQTQFGTKEIFGGDFEKADAIQELAAGNATISSTAGGAGSSAAATLEVTDISVTSGYVGVVEYTVTDNGAGENVVFSAAYDADNETLIQAFEDAKADVSGTVNLEVEINGDGNLLFSTGSVEQSATITLAGTTAQQNEVPAKLGAVFQVGANSGQTESVGINSVKAEDLGQNAEFMVDGENVAFDSVNDINLLANSEDLADEVAGALATIDQAIADVSDNRAELGAFQNRMESLIRNVSVATENLSAAESRIRDTDMALEMVEFTRNQILSQAGTAMLAQANMVPQSVLSLLG